MATQFCLNMIVKNEHHVIKRCLDSVKDFIDYWVIVDTGSTDGTQDYIKKLLADIPGKLYQRPWLDFASNRNEAIELGFDDENNSCDYLLFIDADEVLVNSNLASFPQLVEPRYMLWHQAGNTSTRFRLDKILHRDSDCRYQGVLHEVLICQQQTMAPVIDGFLVHGLFDSARNKQSSQQKYLNDAKVLEQAILELNSPERINDAKDNFINRYTFYLAQSYFDAKEYEKSLLNYKKRASMQGWYEEVWYSLFRIAEIYEKMGQTSKHIEALLEAYQYNPQRAESLCKLAQTYRMQNKFQLAYLFSQKAHNTQQGDDVLFIDQSVYDWRLKDEYAIACYWVGKYEMGLALNQQLLQSEKLPKTERARIKINLQYCLDQIKK